MAFRSLILGVIFLAGCGGEPPTPVTTPLQQDTSIGVGDVFDVRVHGEVDLTSTYRVPNEGSIDFPFIGPVQIAGREPSTVAEEIARRLKDDGYLQDPQVSVFVREYNSKRVSVVGAVTHPGTFPFVPGMTVVQAISAAGGFNSMASRNSAVVTRQTEGDSIRIPVRAGDLAEGQGQDLLLQPGDIIFVPERIL